MADTWKSGAFPEIAPNAFALPYPVRPRGWSFYLTLIGCVLGIAFALFVVSTLLPSIQSNGSVVSLLIALLFALFAGYRLWLLYSPDIVLYSDRVEKRSVFGGWRSLSRGQIRGVGRTVYSRSGSYFDIVPQSAAERPIRLPGSARDDPVVAAWLQGAQDPQAQILAQDRAAVLADARFGANEAEREANLRTAKLVVVVFSVVCIGIAVWIYVSLQPYLFAIAAAVAAPLIGWFLVKSYNGLIL